MRQLGTWKRLALLVAVVALAAAACGSDDETSSGGDGGDAATTTTTAASGPTELVGLFGVDAGECADAEVTAGSYFRMVQPGGTLADGPFVDNGDSTCGDPSYSALEPGDDGGLVTGEYQPQPEPPFDDATNGTASAIITPTSFFGIDFAMATNPTDPQSGDETTEPSLTDDGGTLAGDLNAVGVAYGGQHFNQGAPTKPDGSTPEGTSGPEGTYDADTGAYTLDWTSPIIGGPFDGFTGVWHFEGTFEAS